MQPRSLLGDEDAVAPVVGVVLLVGVAVVIMAVIGAFVLQVGPGEQGPRAELSFAQEDGNVTISVVSSDGLFEEDVDVVVDSDDACLDESNGWDGTLETGDSVVVYDRDDGSCSSSADLNEGDEIRVVWSSSDNTRTEVVDSYIVF